MDSFTYDPANPVPTAGEAMLGGRSGIQLQNAVESRQDVLVYTTEPLINNVEVTGPITVVLYVETDAPSTDFTAKLVDVLPDGSIYNLSDGILRRRYAKSESNQARPAKIKIDVWPTSNVFFKGHKIGLEVSSSNFPHYDRNQNNGYRISKTTKMQSAPQRLVPSDRYPSCVLLPFIP